MAEQSVALTTTQVAYISELAPNTNEQVTDLHHEYYLYDGYEMYGGGNYGRLYFLFPAATGIPERAKLISIRGKLYASSGGSVYAAGNTPNLNTITWNNRNTGTDDYIGTFNWTTSGTSYSDIYPPSWPGVSAISAAVKKFLKNKCLFLFGSRTPCGVFPGVPSTEQWLTIEVYYDDAVTISSQVSQKNCITSGFLNPLIAQTFKWTLDPDGDYYCLADFTQASATLYWRAGTSGTWTAETISGSAQQITIAANTFPNGDSAGTMQWYVEVTDQFGTTSQTPVYTVTTADSLISASPISPVNTVEDGNAVIRFFWNYSSPDGTAPTAYLIEYKDADHSAWTTLISQSDTNSYYDAPAGSFGAGTVQWRVSLTNQANSVGPASQAASFINVAAPAAPSVQVNAVPFAVINWTGSGQEAWRIEIDGRQIAQGFGGMNSYTLQNYLDDGEHNVRVFIQGVYGLWSEAGENVFSIENVSANTLTLSGSFGADAELSWTTESAAADFLIYRDGVRIGHTTTSSFTDRTVLGPHSWRVVNRLADGNYDISAYVTGMLTTDVSMIAALGDLNAGWIQLRLSAKSSSEQSFQRNRTYSLRHFSGAEYPVLELSPFTDLSASYDAAFLPEDSDAAGLEALFGQPVILKSRRGNVMIGALVRLSKSVEDFYNVYSFTLQRIHWEDFIDDAGD